MSGELKKILYVEDEADIRTVAKPALESVGGFEVLICGSGTEAIDQAPGFRPDILLLDVMMPGLDGPDTLVALKRLPELKDALDVIPKPFDPMTLADQVRSIWESR